MICDDQICPVCDGNGWYVDVELETDPYDPGGEPLQNQVQVQCEYCRATGTVEEESRND